MQGKKITNNKYRAEILKLGFEPLEEYAGTHTKIKHRCLTCENIWSVRPSSLKNGQPCPNCGNKKRSNNRKVLNYAYRAEILESGFEPLEEYAGTRTKINHRCLDCNYIWSVRSGGLKSGSGCPNCHNKKKSKRLKSAQKE